jgi:hypothetical protein
LKEEISTSFEKIFSKRIDSIKSEKEKLKEIQNDITSAYSKEKINELQYNLKNYQNMKNNGFNSYYFIFISFEMMSSNSDKGSITF